MFDTGNTGFMLVATSLVMLMTPGLAFFYGGLVRGKNALNTMMMSFASFSMAGLSWVVLGYSLAFSGEGRWLGNLDHLLLDGVGLEAVHQPRHRRRREPADRRPPLRPPPRRDRADGADREDARRHGGPLRAGRTDPDGIARLRLVGARPTVAAGVARAGTMAAGGLLDRPACLLRRFIDRRTLVDGGTHRADRLLDLLWRGAEVFDPDLDLVHRDLGNLDGRPEMAHVRRQVEGSDHEIDIPPVQTVLDPDDVTPGDEQQVGCPGVPTGGEQLCVVVGTDAADGALVPWNLVSGSVEALNLPDAVAVDRSYFKDLGIEGLNSTAEVRGSRVRVTALTHGIRSFTTTPYIFTTLARGRSILKMPPDAATFYLVKLQDGAKSPRFRVVAVSGVDLKIYADHLRKSELKHIAREVGAELVELERGPKHQSDS